MPHQNIGSKFFAAIKNSFTTWQFSLDQNFWRELEGSDGATVKIREHPRHERCAWSSL
jgi:hypothetical protein